MKLICMNKKAVTLIEILISLAILALVSGALASGTNYLTQRLVRAERAGIARHLAWRRLAEIKMQPLLFGHFQGNFGNNFPNYKFDETITHASYQGRQFSGLYEYVLSIQWKEAYKDEWIKIRTLIAEEPQDIKK